MNFRKYTEIDNSDRKKTIDSYVTRGYTANPWIVTTKIHGANFSMYADSNGVKCSKRTSWLSEDENFFNFQKVRNRYLVRVNLAREIILNMFNLDEDTTVQIYGELFGGRYPHPDVEPVQGVKMVQNKVWYCPDVDFFPFDIYIRGEKSTPMSYDNFVKVMDEAGFTLYAKALHVGTFEECLDYPNDYPDPTYKHYGLPEIEGNICEGNVLKPLVSICDPCGSRVILKSKNEKFTERKRVPKERKPVVVSEEAQRVTQVADEYITENRLRNVLSHIGEISQKEFGKLMGAFAQDVRKDMLKDESTIFEKLEKSEEKRVNKTINNACASFIRKHFVNIIDGTF